MLDAKALLSALKNDDDVKVMHTSDGQGDHAWNLNRQEKEKLLNQIQGGHLRR